MSESAPAGRRTRTWLGWGVVGVLAVVVAASFALSSDEEAAGNERRGPKVTPVSAAPVSRGPITERGRYPGELDADAADISSFYAGRLLAVNVRVGSTVARGDVIARLDPVDAREQIAQARAQVSAAAAEAKRAKVEAQAAEADLARLEPLARDKLVSAQELDAQKARTEAARAAVTAAGARGEEADARVRLLQKRIVESEIRAPFAGRVAERYVDPGAIVSAGARLVRLVDSGPLRVRFEVPEHDVPGLAVGATLRVSTKAAATEVPAKVTGIASEVSRERRVAIMEAQLDETPAGWLPGMYAEVVVDRRTIPDALSVPAIAVLQRLQPTGVTEAGVLVDVEGAARWVPVRIVAREGDRVAVEPRGQLAAGAMVLTAGHVDLADGSAIEIVRTAEEPAR